eukprot:1159447-Pelagomonas_calceolata.AAC.10
MYVSTVPKRPGFWAVGLLQSLAIPPKHNKGPPKGPVWPGLTSGLKSRRATIAWGVACTASTCRTTEAEGCVL